MTDFNEKYPRGAEELLTLVQQIPSWTFGETARAEFCLEYLKDLGFDGAYIDGEGSVVLGIGIQPGRNNTAIMAHLDTVFSAGDDFTVYERGGRLCAPSIGDNTANAVGLLLLARYIAESRPVLKGGLYLVWSTGEEGLGNLRGSRFFTQSHAEELKSFVALDLYYSKVYTSCVGSARYRIKVTTPGGHSYLDFGAKNAIAELAGLIGLIRNGVEFNTPGLTYNFGTISGGTTVNTIAAGAELLFEFRSADGNKLGRADKALKELCSGLCAADALYECETIGFRPCAAEPDENEINRLAGAFAAACIECGLEKPETAIASTDCNIPLSLSIPSVCFGVCLGADMHKKTEWVAKGSLERGMQAFRLFFENVFTGENK